VTYYQLSADIYADQGVVRDPDALAEVSFLLGQPIESRIATPIEVPVDHTQELPPRHLLGISVPVFSAQLIDVLAKAGVNNWQLYPAVLSNEATGEQWRGYSAANILGLIDCAVMDRSAYDVIGKRPSGLELVRFDHLVIDPKRTMGLSIFRVAQEPSRILVRDSVVAALEAARPSEGWGIEVVPVEELRAI
jgi:hypothetical protein